MVSSSKAKLDSEFYTLSFRFKHTRKLFEVRTYIFAGNGHGVLRSYWRMGRVFSVLHPRNKSGSLIYGPTDHASVWCVAVASAERCFVPKATAGFHLNEAFDAVKSGRIKKAATWPLAKLRTIWQPDVPSDPYQVGTALAIVNAVRVSLFQKQTEVQNVGAFNYSAVFLCAANNFELVVLGARQSITRAT